MIGVYTKNVGGVWFGVACSEQHVFATAFRHKEQETLKKLLSSIRLNVPFQVFPEPTGFAEKVLSAVKNVYDGKNSPQTFSLATEHLTGYTQRVLEVTSKIPAGYAASYGSIAKTAGGSPRAVGRVMASNPFPPIVPCHRVVSSDFTIGGYGGGVETKLEILTREKRGHKFPQQIPVGDKKLQVFPVEFALTKPEA